MKLFKNRKTYYLYNPNTLSYERVYPSAKDRFFGVLRHLSIGIVVGAGIFFIFSRTFDSPVESLLKKVPRGKTLDAKRRKTGATISRLNIKSKTITAQKAR